MADRFVCKHGLPVSWDIQPADWTDNRMLQKFTVTICKACIEDGTAEALAREMEGMIRRHESALLDRLTYEAPTAPPSPRPER